MPFIPFSYSVALSRTSSTMSNKSREGRLPCLIPDLKAILGSLPQLSMMLAVLLL